MARRKYKEETRPWDWQPERVEEAAPIDAPIRIEDVDGVPIEIRFFPGLGEVARPPSYTTIGPDGEPYTERLVAAAWFEAIYRPWFRRRHGIAARVQPDGTVLDGLLPAIEEEDHGRFNPSANDEESAGAG